MQFNELFSKKAIIGSFFKPKGNTYLPIDRIRVKDLMDIVKQVRM